MSATDIQITTEDAGLTTHLAFAMAFPNPDIILRSNNDVLFPISSETLIRTSQWFRAMFSLPRGAQAVNDVEHISLMEDSNVLAGLLFIVSGIALPALDDIDYVESLLLAAEKYEMSLPIAIARTALSAFLDASPIRVYSIACQQRWEAEAKEAATRTLERDIMSPESVEELRRLDTSNLLKLLSLHEQRRRQMSEALEDKVLFTANMLPRTRCIGLKVGGVLCETPSDDHGTWLAFKLAHHREPWRFLVLREVMADTRQIPELEALFSETCGVCARSLYSEEGTLDNLRKISLELPRTIEWS